VPSAAAAPARHRRPPPARAARALNSDIFWAALALMLVLEGLFPFLSPGGWRQTFQRLLQLRDGQLRFFGLASIAIGLVLLWAVS
jgi:uncharacterized protein YjeT (DUF2065 family)